MRKKNMILLIVAGIIICSIVMTGINILLLGTAGQLFYPAANSIIVMLFWFYRAFGSLPSLIVVSVLYLILIICFIWIIRRKPIYVPLMSIYILDMIGALYLLANGRGLDHILSIIIDVMVLFFILKLQVPKIAKDGRNCRT